MAATLTLPSMSQEQYASIGAPRPAEGLAREDLAALVEVVRLKEAGGELDRHALAGGRPRAEGLGRHAVDLRRPERLVERE
eukprot:2785345-Prymnesium_polylepis.1